MKQGLKGKAKAQNTSEEGAILNELDLELEEDNSTYEKRSAKKSTSSLGDGKCLIYV